MSVHTSPRSDMAPGLPYDRRRLEDIGYMTCMTLTLLGNYAQTGHFGGPLAYTPFNVAAHLAGPELGGLRYDYRRPKHPYGDKFMLAAGHCAPTCYALWMILGQALYRKHHATGDPPLSRRAGRRDAAGRRAGIPPRRRRAEDACSRTRGCRTIRCSPRPRAAASGRCPATSSPPISPTTSTAAPRASESRRRRERPRSGTSSAPPWARRRSSRSRASSP